MSDLIEIEFEGIVEVQVDAPPVDVVEVVTEGPRGPSGPSGTYFTYTQDVPATVWTITHGLGYDPGGITVISDGYLMDGFGLQILEPGVSLRLSFDISLAGVAHLS